MSTKAPWLAFYGDKKATIDYPDTSICDMLFDSMKKHPSLIAYEYFGTLVTYDEFKEKIKECAKALSNLGIKKGDTVTICTPNVPQGLITFYALNYIGAIANMTHPLSSEAEIEFYLKDTNSIAVLTLDIFYEKVSKASINTNVKKIIVASVSEDMKKIMSSLFWITKGRKIPTVPKTERVIFWKEFIDGAKKVNKNVHENMKSKDLAVILYSGGTTGTSKGVMLTNLNFNALALQSAEMAKPNKEGDSILAILPIFHGFGLGVCIHTPLCIGMRVILIPEFKVQKYADLVKKYKPNFIVGVPTLFEAFIKSDLFKEEDSLKYITTVVSGGDNMSEDLKRKVNEFLDSKGSLGRVQEGYGLTESTGASCLAISGYNKGNSIGIPFPDVFYKIVYTGTMKEAPYGTEGEICITGPTVMKGYLNNTEETYNVLKKHSDGKVWLHTGDLGHMDEDGWVFFKQRLKRVIVSSGYCIYPNYIENILKYNENIENCVVVGIDDPRRVQKIRAYIILKNGVKHTEEVEKDIYEHCKKSIAKYSIPHEFEYIKEFPKTLVGKVSFKTLVAEDAGLKVDPLLINETIKTNGNMTLQFKDLLNWKKWAEKAAKVTKKRIDKALKKEQKEYQKQQKEKIETVIKNSKK